jgi:signal transduction histidine kinase
MFSLVEVLRFGLLSVLIFQVLVIIMQVIINKRKEAVYYLLYIVGVFLYNYRFLVDGSSIDNHYHIQLYFDRPVVALIFWSYFKFARLFLEMPSRSPEFNQIGIYFERYLLLCTLIFCGLIFFNTNTRILDIIFNFFCIFSAAFSLYYIVYFIKPGRSALNSFIVIGAALILTGSTVTFLLYEYQKINPVLNTANLTIPHLIATIFELVVFNSGIALKSYILEKEKRDADLALISQMQQNEAVVKDLNNVKSSISADLHDDIGATFNSIDIYATVTEKALHTGDVLMALEYQKKIRSLASESLSDIRDTIWLLRQNRNICMSFLVEKWIDRAKPLLEAKGIDLIYKNDHTSDKQITLNERRHLYFSMKEILNNILKHSGTKIVEVSNYHMKSRDWIVIKDFGTGFDKNTRINGEGLKNIEMRIKLIGGVLDITSSQEKGTTISIGI